MSIKPHVRQLSRYALAGGLATVVHLCLAWILMYSFSASVWIANMLAFFVAFIFSYVFQTRLVFQSHFAWSRFSKFLGVQFAAFLLSFLLSSIIPLHNAYIQTLLIVLIIPAITFLVHKFWTFGSP